MIKRPSPSIVVSFLALVVALGGAGYSATGGNFILGQTNTAATQTKLLAPIAGASFRVDNTSTAAAATAMTLVVTSGRPPFATNSAVKVANLNADHLDGVSANELLRAGRAFNLAAASPLTFADLVSITLNIPKAGFVLLSGQVTIGTTDAACIPCFLHVQFEDQLTNDVSPVLVSSVEDGGAASSNVTVSTSWLFPVTAGTRTFALQSGGFPVGAAISKENPAMTALYVPFGPTGTLALTGGTPSSAPSMALRLGPPKRDGTRAVLR